MKKSNVKAFFIRFNINKAFNKPSLKEKQELVPVRK